MNIDLMKFLSGLRGSDQQFPVSPLESLPGGPTDKINGPAYIQQVSPNHLYDSQQAQEMLDQSGMSLDEFGRLISPPQQQAPVQEEGLPQDFNTTVDPIQNVQGGNELDLQQMLKFLQALENKQQDIAPWDTQVQKGEGQRVDSGVGVEIDPRTDQPLPPNTTDLQMNGYPPRTNIPIRPPLNRRW